VKQVAFPVKTLPARFFLAERSVLGDSLEIAATLPRGTGVVLRDYDACDREAMARRLARIARRRGLILLIAGDSRLAWRVGAQGVHLPQWRLFGRPPPRRRGWLVTAAAHDRQALARAQAIGADAALVSPVFATGSHPAARPLGVHRLARMTAGAPLPIYALGGIDAHTLHRLPDGLAGVAAIAAFADQKFRRVPRYSMPERSRPSATKPKRCP